MNVETVWTNAGSRPVVVFGTVGARAGKEGPEEGGLAVQTPRRARLPVQLRFGPWFTSETYVSERGWLQANLERCPVHPEGGCGFRRHTAYRRVWPEGALIARWYCPDASITFSLLPDFLAAGIKGPLAEIAEVAAAVEAGPSLEAVAAELRPDVTLPAAIRWTRRRVRWFREAATIARGVVGELLGARPVPSALAEALAVEPGAVLDELRARMAAHLRSLARPTGLCPRWRTRAIAEGRNNRSRGRRARGPPS